MQVENGLNQDNQRINSDGEGLIFLISQPRAGSTLLQRILANHSKIYTVPEPWISLYPTYALRPSEHHAGYNSNFAHLALQDFLAFLPNGEDIYFEAIAKMLAHLYNAHIEATEKQYFLDKTPRYYYIIPEIYRIFPKAKFIILFRNPLAVLCSIINTWIKKDWARMSLYKDDLLKAPDLLIKGIELLPKENCLSLKYEKLILDPISEAKIICHFLNIEFDSEMVNYSEKDDLKGFGYQEKRNDISFAGKPAEENLDRWIRALKEPQTWRNANDYLNMLDPKVLKKMGYDYDDLKRVIDKNFPSSLSTIATFPLKPLLVKPRGLKGVFYSAYILYVSFHVKGFGQTVRILFQKLQSLMLL